MGVGNVVLKKTEKFVGKVVKDLPETVAALLSLNLGFGDCHFLVRDLSTVYTETHVRCFPQIICRNLARLADICRRNLFHKDTGAP